MSAAIQPNSKTANAIGVGFSDMVRCVEVSTTLKTNLATMKRLLGEKWESSAKEYRDIIRGVMIGTNDDNPIACALPMAKEMSNRGHTPLMLLAVATEMAEASNDGAETRHTKP